MGETPSFSCKEEENYHVELAQQSFGYHWPIRVCG